MRVRGWVQSTKAEAAAPSRPVSSTTIPVSMDPRIARLVAARCSLLEPTKGARQPGRQGSHRTPPEPPPRRLCPWKSSTSATYLIPTQHALATDSQAEISGCETLQLRPEYWLRDAGRREMQCEVTQTFTESMPLSNQLLVEN